MGLALLFPGQGAQQAQMLPWLESEAAAAPALAALATQLGADWRTRTADTAWLHANAVAQPLLAGVSLAAWQAVAARLPAPVAVAGYSVGELAAFSAAGLYDADTALSLAARRAAAMDAAAAGHAGGLLSVQGPRAAALADVAPGLAVAIRIGPERALVGGPALLLEAAATAWTAAGLRCTRLPIAIASHTPWMAAAAEAFAQHLATLTLRPPRTAVVCNFTGTASRHLATLVPALSAQMAATVRWDECMDSLAERGVRCVLELGPGATLSAMWRERHPGIPARSADEFRSAEGLVGWVRQQLA